MFQVGVDNSFKKMNAGKMREKLCDMYPHRFSIPGETEIKSFISAQVIKSKYKKKTANSGRGRPSAENTQIREWVLVLNTCVKTEKYGKPAKIYGAYLAIIGEDKSLWPKSIPLLDGNPDKKKIKEIISRIKSDHKKQITRSIV